MKDPVRLLPTLHLLVLGLLLPGSAAMAAGDLHVLLVDPAFAPFDDSAATVTIKGLGFTPLTTVSFDGDAAATTFVDARTLSAVVPVLAAERISTVSLSDPAGGQDEFYPFLHTGPVIYVSTSGDDAHTGLDPNAPKRTLDGGLYSVSGSIPTEIRVAGGLYLEAEVRVWHATVLSCGWSPDFTSRDPDAHVTEISAGRTGFVLRTAGINNASVIDGCTVSRGFRDSFGGGGIAVSADSTVVNNNVIVGNSSATIGGGIYWTASTAYGGKPTFSNNVILGNRAFNLWGGGIGVYPIYNTLQEIRVNITGNEILGNRSFGGRGGGVSLSTASYAGYNRGILKMSGNRIGGNRAREGAGVNLSLLTYGDHFDLLIENELVAWNGATGAGGGMALLGMGRLDGSVTTSTLSGNAAAPGMGGGLLMSGSLDLLSAFRIRDLVLWGNSGGDFAGWDQGRITYSLSGSALAGEGNIGSDPLFVAGARGAFYLSQGDPNAASSPALDSGSGDAAALSMDCLTTCSQATLDGGQADLGYHYPVLPGEAAAPLEIARLDPPSGDFQGHDWVLVRGSGFTSASTVEFSGVLAAGTLYLSGGRLLVSPPAHPLGFVNVRVRNPGGDYADAISGYRYEDTEPPLWESTVGIVSAHWPQDCVRTAVLEWNRAVDGVSPPVFYDIHREECLPSYEIGVPCENFGFTPNATNQVGSTVETTFLDRVFPNQDLKWIYNVRARDSATPYNKEWNFGRKVVDLVGYDNYDVTPPEEVGNTLAWTAGTTELLDWVPGEATAEFGFYRTTAASDYGDPGTMTPYAVLGPATHDGNGDGVADSLYQDTEEPLPGEAFFYRVTAIDPCGNETTGELLPPLF